MKSSNYPQSPLLAQLPLFSWLIPPDTPHTKSPSPEKKKKTKTKTWQTFCLSNAFWQLSISRHSPMERWLSGPWTPSLSMSPGPIIIAQGPKSGWVSAPLHTLFLPDSCSHFDWHLLCLWAATILLTPPHCLSLSTQEPMFCYRKDFFKSVYGYSYPNQTLKKRKRRMYFRQFR